MEESYHVVDKKGSQNVKKYHGKTANCLMSSHYVLLPQERDFLIDVFENPFSSMTGRYKRLGFNNRLGNKIIKCLVNKGLFDPIEITTKKGRTKLLELTEEETTVLDEMGCQKKPIKGEGGC